jgi:hypothetical protein
LGILGHDPGRRDPGEKVKAVCGRSSRLEFIRQSVRSELQSVSGFL